MKAPNKQYSVWVEEGEDSGYFTNYDSKEDAAECHPGEEVFETTYKSIGYSEFTTKVTFTKGKKK